MTVGNWVNFAWTGKVVQVMKATAPKPYYLCSAPGSHDGKREQTLPPHRCYDTNTK